jgi:amino acid adenylation domain-containing protein/non-ribosomal peptide synthase protein (TIGR01720 family)
MNIANLLKHTLAAMAQTPELLIDELDLVSERDRQQIYTWNRGWPEMVFECAHDLIGWQIEQQPALMALSSPEGDFTYGEVGMLSTRLAHFLKGLGVGPEVIVPLCFEKSAWAIISMLAVMKAGGALVFLDPAHPLSRREEILTQAKARFILGSPTTAPIWGADTTFDVLTITCEFIEALPEALHPVESDVKPSNAMYVVFTSGSTGTPKGCIIEHRNFCSGAKVQIAGSKLGSSSRVSQFASYTFDVSILEIVTGLMSGACVCVPTPESFSKGLASVIVTHGITWAFLTPSLVRLMRPAEVPTLRTLVLGGEALTSLEIETWADHLQLINGYGPSECSIAASANPNVSREDHPANIGRAIGGVCWIVDAQDSDRLVPVGVVGELLIQGPILARGYLENPIKTAEAFIENPAWTLHDGYSGEEHRFYKTGDLARYNADGSIHFVGRKDTQVKLRGQRIELGEIEHHLMADKLVRLAMITLPKVGPCSQKLVAVLSLSGITQPPAANSADAVQILDMSVGGVGEDMNKIQANLANLVPSYMVPTVWIAVHNLPLLPSGKLNRVKVSQWISKMSNEVFYDLVGVNTNGIGSDLGTTSERLLQQIYGQVLNLDAEIIPLNKSFLSLGGDSISAMQVIARCRENGRAISMADILRSKGIAELALQMREAGALLEFSPEVFNTPFKLSPVQQMYFQTASGEGSSTHYNQSFILQMTQAVPEETLALSLKAVIERHSILRARFDQDLDGHWTQRILEEVPINLALFSSHNIDRLQDANPILKEAHSAINFRTGPIFAARLFDAKENGKYLFLTAHHLVVDLVSWRIIMQDLEKLAKGEVLGASGLPWQTWLKLQEGYAEENLHPAAVLPFEAPAADYDYWGMVGQNNRVGDTMEETVSISAEETSLLFGSDCHTALQTEPIDLLLASLFHAFTVVFSDRQSPVLFREGHGREPWSDDIDLSRTVGWFTTMYPLHIADSTDDVVDIVRKFKDARHSVPANGWPYFTSRFLNTEGRERFGEHKDVEITFDYLGLYQQLERDDALFRLVPRDEFVVSEVGADILRFMLVEVTAEMIAGRMQYQFIYNKYMKHGDRIHQWIRQSMESLRLAISRLSSAEKQFTLSDFPLLSLTYEELQVLTETRLPDYGIGLDNIEDIYPCTPMQRGLLFSQLKQAGTYEYFHVMEIQPSSSNTSVDISRLRDAWAQVVSRHTVLRTIFVESHRAGEIYDQVVLKQIKPSINELDCLSEDYLSAFDEQQPVTAHSGKPLHRLSICVTTTKRVFCKLEMNHAIADGASLPVILHDLVAAYDSQSAGTSVPFSKYVSHIQQSSGEVALHYWKEYLQDLEPCNVKFAPQQGQVTPNSWDTTQVDLGVDLGRLNAVCERYGVTVSNILRTAWALVLQQYTDVDCVTFGYLSSGRDVPVAGIEDAVGPYLTMLICHLNVEQESSLGSLLETERDDFTRSLPNQFCSLADIQHVLGMSGLPLFNTVFSLQKKSPAEQVDTGIRVNLLAQHDPTEV